MPNIVIVLWLFLMLTFSVTTAERNFSKLKLIKSYLRLSKLQDCLFNLSLISIEHETVEKIKLLLTLLLQNIERLKYDYICSANL